MTDNPMLLKVERDKLRGQLVQGGLQRRPGIAISKLNQALDALDEMEECLLRGHEATPPDDSDALANF